MNRADAAEQIVADLRELAALTSDENGAQRLSWTPTWRKATEWFRRHMEAAGAEVSMDAVGNIWAKFAGESEASVVVGLRSGRRLAGRGPGRSGRHGLRRVLPGWKKAEEDLVCRRLGR